jgi:dihydropyrimidinase
MLTMSRGKIVAQDGEVIGEKGHGIYLPRERSPFATGAR